MTTLSRVPIVLASKSASRKAMLEAAGISFEVAVAQCDERALEAEMGDADPAEIAQALAAAKAASVQSEQLVLGSDSLVEVAGCRFDKPSTREDAAAHLRFFSGKVMTLHSAAALARDGQIIWVGSDFARLRFRELTDEFVDVYLQVEWPAVSSCVGGFRIEGPGVQLFDGVAGDQFTVLGMPLLQVLEALRIQNVLIS